MKPYNLPEGVKESSLRPYPGRLFIAYTKSAYEAATLEIFGEKDKLDGSEGGKFNYAGGKDGISTYVVWGSNVPYWTHEMSHVVLHLFQRVGVNPVKSTGEPFCYMVQALMEDVSKLRPRNYSRA